MKKTIALMTALLTLSPAGSALAVADWSSINISNYNNSEVTNIVEVSATTGGNVSMGGNAGNEIIAGGEDNTNGGNFATGGMGGEISTGEALITVDIANIIGSNYTSATTSEADASETVVSNINESLLVNIVALYADTGLNDTTGGNGYNTIDGSVWSEDSWHGDNSAEAGMGGLITTGASSVSLVITNLLNSNVTRVSP